MAQRLMKAPTIVRFSACLYQSRQVTKQQHPGARTHNYNVLLNRVLNDEVVGVDIAVLA